MPEVKTGMMGIFEFEQAMALKDIGHKVVYSYCDVRSIKYQKRFYFKQIIKDGVLVCGYHLPLGGIPKKLLRHIKYIYFKKIIEKIIDNDGLPDIIYIHFPLISLNKEIWDFIKKLNIPIAITEHWTKVQEKAISNSTQMLLTEMVSVSSAVICVSEQLKNSVIDLTGTQKKIYVIPNMVSCTFKYKQKEKNGDAFKFITVGRLVTHKRFNIVIDAFAKAFADNPSVKLTVIGNGDQFDKLKQQIDMLQLNDAVTMTGYVSREDIVQYYDQCDAFVSASVLESFGVPFIEAMMCGMPVICTKGSPIEEYVNISNGLTFIPDDIDGLSEAMIKIYKNRYLYKDKSISENAMKNFSASAIAQKLEDIFEGFIIKK
ncbi:glycosyltransferase [Desulforamulus aeronauticus]|uniref:Glycosyltransferase involved in cell wall bisynthesis n=1 Tax=Desulforamulus aeronauticus DSM 10349 TaxID=1121421 RepID=A0A1M6V415_9FIRM|nr:glycosyltransferase [Desulforamulus aeronauticus]SHK76188.1 Glycosyltransferase involved in cell wall bisynthesis [Desulforamulus aeronauticus DSM 10349]